MAQAVRVSGPVGSQECVLSFESGELAQLAHGSVLAQLGDTTVLVTAVTAEPREGIDFFPLTVDVEERMYAAGKIPGSFFRREGRPTEQAILTCRLTDRPLRPSFPEGFRNEVQVVATVLGADMVNPHDVLAINGASAALVVSGIPFAGPIGAVRIAHIDGRWVSHPSYEERAEATFDMVVAGRRIESGDIAIMMVEAGGGERSVQLYEEGAPKVDERLIAEGLEESKKGISDSIDLQLELRAELEKVKGPIEERSYTPRFDYDEEVAAAVRGAAEAGLSEALQIGDKAERNERIDGIVDGVIGELAGTEEAPGAFAGRQREIKAALRSLQKEIVRSRIVKEGFRIDGRKPDEIRPLSARVGVIPTVHGSGLFQRGETQVLTVATLGMPRLEQMLDTIGVEDRKRYMHHYNFPPFSTSEVGRVGAPRRREIGHGALAERALLPVIPPADEFPYALRVVSDVLASNGSTSMASVCGSSLSLMDAGVPIKDPVAGIAMGLVYADGEYTTLTDILGAEDAFGDMDFKVAGTADYVTALQLDTKIDGIPAEVLAKALDQAREARLKILDTMRDAIAEPRPEVGETAPKIVSIEIPLDKVGEVIGPKGKVVNTIQQETGADIAIGDDGTVGTVTVGAAERSKVDAALEQISLILNPPQPELGELYQGKVVNITSFGAFINILPGRDGLVHISKLGGSQRIDRVEDVLEMGQEVTVKVDDIDPRGKLSLTLVEEGAEGEASPRAEARPRAEAPAADEDTAERASEGEFAGEERAEAPAPSRGGDRDQVSFGAEWEREASESFGDLGPAGSEGGRGRGDRDRGESSGRGDRGSGGRGRRPRRR